MAKASRSLFIALLCFLCAHIIMSARFNWSVPVLDHQPLESHGVMDLSFVGMGIRRLGSDIAFIQYLQYIMTPRHERLSENIFMKSPEKEDRTFDYTLRMIEIDPYNHYAYLLGSGLLAFELEKY